MDLSAFLTQFWTAFGLPRYYGLIFKQRMHIKNKKFLNLAFNPFKTRNILRPSYFVTALVIIFSDYITFNMIIKILIKVQMFHHQKKCKRVSLIVVLHNFFYNECRNFIHWIIWTMDFTKPDSPYLH